MTLPRSSGCTRTSRTLPRRSARVATWTSSGYWTMPRTRCSRASSSTLPATPARFAARRLADRGRHVSSVPGARVRCLRDVGRLLGFGGLGGGGPGGPGCPRLGPALALLGAPVFPGFLAGLALLGRGREALLLVRARLGRPEGALAPRFPGELLPVPGDLEQGADRVGGLRAYREPVLHPLGVHFDERGLGLRVVLADLLDGAPVALGACVRDDDPVIGFPDLAQALQLDLDSHGCGLLPALRCDAAEPRRPGNSRQDRTDEPGPANEERASHGLAVSITLCQTTGPD